MEFGMFHEFQRLPGASDASAFADSLAQVDEAERLGLDAMWLAELHFNPERLTALAAEVAGTHPASVMQAFLPRLGAQIDEQVKIGAMRSIAPDQFFVNLVALCVFPFIARPVLRIVFGQDDAAFSRFLDERRRELPDFILNALRP